ncbi:hypothetical protein [Ancylobacter mangrovi]|uniref:Uncharacterized protein n=1 Tax=Ancylobacter mangrovi TaxID=2972472 RepID=A0A9X2PJM8_9HYPH|nr:hypothetical protein [Ancylobacter mangrovi]MCS0496412.1 hypothetical protein [Ancylobacter mangrovi]MCS0504423.1 hypothetical protein [Ancylobacter mangrovi]
MSATVPEGQLLPGIGVIETVESDNILRWDGADLYVEQDVYHNGQLVHRRYRRRVTRPVAQAIAQMLAQH